ncbi:hypothetical protein LRY65_02880 [Candidatus Woesebacteria bacterium]|nr:hypothetical protein [Candidatus Woesebacteria bacterium]MCD8507713.1 hypothetical protein [Candidatus Woesebacteria bacterium]MCD8527135.1 hypothetical protein [Candidatus Woesebacteria bacterium]MCD8546828.1 hypothetical protein [Candidatus Woesebacteria bacterium]
MKNTEIFTPKPQIHSAINGVELITPLHWSDFEKHRDQPKEFFIAHLIAVIEATLLHTDWGNFSGEKFLAKVIDSSIGDYLRPDLDIVPNESNHMLDIVLRHAEAADEVLGSIRLPSTR